MSAPSHSVRFGGEHKIGHSTPPTIRLTVRGLRKSTGLFLKRTLPKAQAILGEIPSKLCLLRSLLTRLSCPAEGVRVVGDVA